MYCFNCGRHIRGMINRVRHSIAESEPKYDFDCKKMFDVDISKAKKWLETKFFDSNKKQKTYRQVLEESRPKPCIKFNKRNHNGKSNGSEERTKILYDLRRSRGHKTKR